MDLDIKTAKELEEQINISNNRGVKYHKVTERQGYAMQNFLILSLILMFLGFVDIMAVFIFGFNLLESSLLILTSVVLYVGLFLFLSSYSNKESKTITRTIQKPVVKEIIKEIEKPVYVEASKEKLVIPKYDYVGSTQTRTYHLRNCRLAKLVKNKYKLSNNSLEFFKKRKFKACKICIRKLRKA